MFKFTLTKQDNRKLLGFGITGENVERLKNGQPIYVDLRDMGIDADITIFYAETEQAIYEQLNPFIGEMTQLHPPDNGEIPDSLRVTLRAAGYRVKSTKYGYSPVSPNNHAIIRGWTKTESEAWQFCKKHYEQRNTRTNG